MGWLLAFLFAIVAGVFGFLLFVQFDERRKAVAFSQQAVDRIRTLESAEAERAKLQKERDSLAKTYLALRTRVAGLANADEEKERVVAEANALRDKFNSQLAEARSKFNAGKQKMDEEIATLEAALRGLRNEHRLLSEEASLREMAFYESRYTYTTSQAFKEGLHRNVTRQKEMLQSGSAASCSRDVAIDGNAEAGRRQAENTLALMLRAFNGECDAAVGKVRCNNFQAMENRIQRAFTTINKLAEPQACAVSEAYLDLKVEELRLTHEHAMKVQAEREEQRALKEQMREEAKASREAEKAVQEAEAEERRRQVALERVRADLEQAAREQASSERHAELEARMRDLEQQLAEAHANSERAMSLAQQTKVGHVYVISNVGAFGENVFKIGMTRRHDPMDRIWELSDASVPFDFDVHAIIRSDDAPALEAELHSRFADRRINMVNQRREFFFVTIDEIAEVVRSRCGDVELTMAAEAMEFLQSEAHRKARGMPLLARRQMVAVDEVVA
jgi:hypothetical protein